jgi:hypothetical protein
MVSKLILREILSNSWLSASRSGQKFLFHLFVQVLKAMVEKPMIEFFLLQKFSTMDEMPDLEIFFLELMSCLKINKKITIKDSLVFDT